MKLKTKLQLLDESTVKRTLMRLSYEIVEKNADLCNTVLVGIRTRGLPLAERLSENIAANSGVKLPVGALDITYYRDDLERLGESPRVGEPTLPFEVTGKEIVLVDDVLFTGRTVRAAIDAIFSVGRPAKIRLAVLVDRGHRELPIRPDYVGKNVPSSMNEVICVHLTETDGVTNVEICEKEA